MKAGKTYYLICLISAIVMGCIQPYELPVRDEEVGFLVVDGYINTGEHSATVKLSRAIPLSSTSQFPKETNAVVSVEAENGQRYELTQEEDGIYFVNSSDFTNGKRYRLHIRTASGKEYLSAQITTRDSPPIDSLSWSATPEGVTIKLDTEDPDKQTRYYRWEFTETWRYESVFSSEYELINGQAIARSEQDQLKVCYTSEPSSAILTSSTVNFTLDKLVDREITFIPLLSPKTRHRYSILVKQYALSKEAYDYWQQLSINTQSLGGLFDPQPAQLRGNITRADDSSEPVIGYFDGGSIAEKRLFIDYLELPEYLQKIPLTPECTQQLVILDSLPTLNNTYMLTHSVYWEFILVGYNYTWAECADCRKQGGTTQKPSFWPN